MRWPRHKHGGRGRRGIGPLIAMAVGVIAILLLVQVAVIGLLSAGRAYVHAEGRWSKAQQEAVFRLDRYAETGRRAELAAARQALEVPMGDRRARRALQGEARDYAAARAGFLQGGNHPADIPYLIRLFEYFEHAPYMDRAIAIWREGDRHIARLNAVADELERAHASDEVDRERIAALRERIREIDAALRPLENRFSAVLGAGLRDLRRVLAALSAGSTVALVGLVALVFGWGNRRIAESEERFAATFRHAPLGVALLASDGRLVDVNEAFCRLLRRGRDELLGAGVDSQAHPDDRDPELLARVAAARERRLTLERRYVAGDDTEIWGRLTITAYPGGLAGDSRFIAVLEDISEMRRRSEELAYQASHDALTGMPNRRWLEAELERLLADPDPARERHVLAYVDLDGFKAVNDTCGHTAGDTLLSGVADCMHRSLRGSDVLARVGGDEFAVLLRHCDVEAARVAIRKLCDAVRAFRFECHGSTFGLTASVGIAGFDAAETTVDRVLARADAACYAAKQAGGDRVLATDDDECRSYPHAH